MQDNSFTHVSRLIGFGFLCCIAHLANFEILKLLAGAAESKAFEHKL